MADEVDIAGDAAQVIFDAALRNARASVVAAPQAHESVQNGTCDEGVA